jgi:mannitol/fructose-specific phosphotransferase system IIA component (Ntr-type)
VSLAALLREEQIVLGLSAREKNDVLEALLVPLVAGGRLKPGLRNASLDALKARERVASTGMEHGIAIPHASLDALEEPLAVLGLSPDGVPFQAADGAPSRILVLLLIPRKAVSQHTRTLAGIARLLQYEEIRDELLRSRSAREILQIVRREEPKDA